MTQHLRGFLADQIRALRGTMSQAEFGRRIGKPQSVVSRLENEDYGKLGLQTLIDVATRLDVAVVVRFVDYPDFLRMTSDFSNEAVAPRPYPDTRSDISGTEQPVTPSTSVRNETASKKPGHRSDRRKQMRA